MRGDGPAVCERLESLCTVSKDSIGGRAGELLRLREWERQFIYRLFARRPDGRRRHRTGLIGLPRKNGKSTVCSGFAIDGLLFDVDGAEVYCAAADRDQARIVFEETKRMIMVSPDLMQVCNPMQYAIDVPTTRSVFRVLSSEAYTKEGLNPSRNIVDELHAHPTPDLWNVLMLGQGARVEPMTIAITTAGTMTDRTGDESTCYRLFKRGVAIANGELEDDSFFMAWWGAPQEADWTDRKVWKAANPGYGDIKSPEVMEEDFRSLPENEFRTKHLNQWVTGTKAFLPQEAWGECADPHRVVGSKEPIVVAFDGSLSNDSTGLVGCTASGQPHLFVLGAWERPARDNAGWRVPMLDVMERFRQINRDYNVLEFGCDTHLWQRVLEELLEEGLPMVAFPQQGERMVPATSRFYEAVTTKTITHDGDERLSRHVANCRTVTTARGTKVMKETKASPLKIDLAVASIMALDLAAKVVAAPEPRVHVFSLSELLDDDD